MVSLRTKSEAVLAEFSYIAGRIIEHIRLVKVSFRSNFQGHCKETKSP